MPVISPESVANGNKSCYTCIGGPVAEMGSFLHLIFNAYGNQQAAVDVYVGSDYTIQYFDVCSQSYLTVSGTVVGISTEHIALHTVKVVDSAGNVCLCANKNNLSGYVGTETYHIPITNIYKIVRIDGGSTPIGERSETIVMVLGITSMVIRSVIVRLKILNGDIQHTCTNVDMQVGNVYHVVYTKENSNTTYEITGRLIRIEEVPQFTTQSIENGYVRQDVNLDNPQVGMYGNTYDPGYFYALPKNNPDGNRIKFVFDTSKDFCQLCDSVMLKDIRDVQLVQATNPTPPPYPPYYPPPPCPPQGPSDWPPCWQPGDYPPGYYPGGDPVDPGFTNPNNPITYQTTTTGGNGQINWDNTYNDGTV